jgi:hypothetical protein
MALCPIAARSLCSLTPRWGKAMSHRLCDNPHRLPAKPVAISTLRPDGVSGWCLSPG